MVNICSLLYISSRNKPKILSRKNIDARSFVVGVVHNLVDVNIRNDDVACSYVLSIVYKPTLDVFG